MTYLNSYLIRHYVSTVSVAVNYEPFQVLPVHMLRYTVKVQVHKRERTHSKWNSEEQTPLLSTTAWCSQPTQW